MEYPLFRSLHLNQNNEYGILHSSYQYYYLLGCLISIRYSILYTQHSTLAKIDAPIFEDDLGVSGEEEGCTASS